MIFQLEKLSQGQDNLKIVFGEKLDIESVAEIWRSCVDTVTQQSPCSLLLDCSKVNYCDGAGLSLLKTLEEQQINNNKNCSIIGLNPSFQKLLEHIKRSPNNVIHEEMLRRGLPERLGYITLDVLKNIHDNIVFLGMLSYQLFFSLLKPRKIRWADFLRIAEDTGPQAVPIIALIGFLIGLISTFQAEPSFANFGVQVYLIDLVGLGLVREMGPLLTAVLLAGRTASSFAAEIGTMKVNQEIDALKTMGLDPIRFLIVPRVLVTMLVTPILEMFFIIFGLFGCLIFMLSLGYTADSFFHRLYEAIVPMDYLGGLIKVFVFGMVIASVGCLHGLKTHLSAKAIGQSTTQAVVSSLIMLVIVDGIFASVYYVLGI